MPALDAPEAITLPAPAALLGELIGGENANAARWSQWDKPQGQVRIGMAAGYTLILPDNAGAVVRAVAPAVQSLLPEPAAA